MLYKRSSAAAVPTGMLALLKGVRGVCEPGLVMNRGLFLPCFSVLRIVSPFLRTRGVGIFAHNA